MSDTAIPHELALPGLREDNPRDFLATLGLLRIVDLLWPESEPKLYWAGEPRIPIISMIHTLPLFWSEVVIANLKELATHVDKPFVHGEIIKTTGKQFRLAVENALRFAESDHPLSKLPLMLYASYSSQIEAEGGEVEPTGFSFANGQSGKKLLLDVAQLIESIDGENLLSTLRGEGSPVGAKSLRWNPSEFRPAAYRSHDPGSKLKGDESQDYPELNVLAFFGLSFFPTPPTIRGGTTLGFHVVGRERYFHWPTWTSPLGSDQIATLVCSDISQMISLRGVDQVWRSRRFSSDKSLYFAPAELAN
ncbi:MAG: hypothetical protein JNJ70_18500 [Verrucomicrobiales bacterium]|nr:hypothetical protein [Verrucomicrobiales bacterium]